MFEALRKMIFPIIIIVLVFFLGMIVLQWGAGITSRDQGVTASVAGIINGEEISWDQYHRVYNNLYQSELQKSGGDVTDTRSAELEDEAWDQIVADRLLNSEAEKNHVTVTDDDVYLYLRLNPPVYLQQQPVFQTDGRFVYQKYIDAMADPQYSQIWSSVEPLIKADIKKVKIQQLIAETANASEAEIKQSFMDTKETIKVGMVNIRRNTFYQQVPRPDTTEAKEYFDSHREDYKVDERVELEIVKVSKEPSAYDEQQAFNTAEEIYDSAVAGADFAELAEIWSEDPGSASKGGDLGWFAPGRMVAPFDSAAFAMKEGEISPPIKTQFGWHILKHFGYKEEAKSETDKTKVRMAKVSHILVKVKASSETLDQAYSKLEEFSLLADEKGFEAAADELGLEIVNSGPVLKIGRVNVLDRDDKIVTWAFSNDVGAISGVRETSQNYYVAKLSEKLAAGLADFESVVAKIQRELQTERIAKLCMDTAAVIYDAVKNGESLEKAATKYGFKYEVQGPFTRRDGIQQLGTAPKPVGTAFGLAKIGDVSTPVDYPSGTVIMELLERTSPDLMTYNEKRDSVFAAVSNAKRTRTYNNWFSKLREDAKIVCNVGQTATRR